MSHRVGMEDMLVKALGDGKKEKVGKKEKEVSEITKQMKELHQMSRFLQDKLSTLESSLSDIKDTSDDEEEEIFEDVDIDSDDEIIELPAPDPKDRVSQEIITLISPKKEPFDDLDVESRELLNVEDSFNSIEDEDDDLDEESRELLNIDESYLDDEDSNPTDFTLDGSMDVNQRYIGHQMDEEPENIISEVDIKLEVKEETIDPSDLSLPQGWKVRRSKGKMEGRFLYNSPDGKYFHSLYTVIEYMLQNDFSKTDVGIMKSNLRHEGWKEMDYLPSGWLVTYYKPSNGFHYLSPDCKFFKSAKSVMDFMKKNNYNPNIIKDIKREMQDSKKFTGKIKYKWQEGDNTLPKGWKLRKTKGTGRHQTIVEFILSDDGIQFKSRFEALHFIMSNKYSDEKVKDLRAKLLISSEKWKENQYLPKDWIFKFKGEDASKDKNPTSTSITYLSREGHIFHSMKSIMDFMKTSLEYDEKDIGNCKEFLKNVVRFAETKYQWLDGDDSVPSGWKVRVCDGETDREYILSPEGLPYRSRYVAIQDMFKRDFSKGDIEIMKIKMVQFENWERSDLLPTGWMFKIISEGRTKDGKWYSSIHYISLEGLTFESMRTIVEFLKSSNKYTQEDIEKCKEFLVDQKSCFKKYEWNAGDSSILTGWKMRVSDSENKWQYYLSPEGRQYRTRYVAIQDMVKRNYSRSDIEKMKVLMMKHECWEQSDLLPKGWMFKNIAEGFTKENKWYSTLHYLSDDGITFESMKTILDHMKSSENFSDEEMEKCQEFLKDQKSVLKKYEWNEGDESVPKGWKMRTSTTEGKWQFILSPESRQYRTRFVAIQDMIKRNCSEEEVQVMRSKLIEYEGWETSEYLPHNWTFRVKWEGLCKDNKWTTNIGYLSREGVAYESMRPVILYMRSSDSYTEKDEEKCKEFIKKRNQDTQEERFEWKEGNDTVPAGWKMRISDGDAEMEWILSPDGRMFRSRVLALQDMIKQEYKQEDIQIMRKKLIHEGWQRDKMFPEGWLLKKWEGKKRSRGKLNQDLKFLTVEGERLESFKTVIDYMNNLDAYTNEDVENVRKFKEQWSITLRRGGFEWEDGDETVPEGWKKRRGHGKTESEYILSPEGVQYRSRYNALMNLYKDNAAESLIQEMRSKLTFEGWESIQLIPQGWMFKRIWEGMISNGTFSTNTHYITREGNVYESAKTAIEFMEIQPEYDEKDVLNFKEFQTLLNKVTTKKREDWIENDTVPAGWKTRTTTGASGREYVLRPDGQQFMSRINALQHMIKENYDESDIAAMRSKLFHEGWKSDDFLPADWLYKVISEGFTKENKWYNSLHYLSREGESFESMKTALEFIQTSKDYSDKDIENCKSFLNEQKSCFKKYDWKEGDLTILPDWKMRISESENEWQFYLSPEGKQYRSRYVAIQDMYKRGYNVEDIEEMKNLMVEHEGWERNRNLPKGWLFKNVSEGFTKDNKWYSTLHYLSSEGLTFQSMSTIIDHLKSTEIYTEEDIEKCKEFLKDQKPCDKKYEWNDGGDSVPFGWKIRKSDSEQQWEFYLSPDGRQYRTRYVALLDMVKREFDEDQIEEMKEKMIIYEGWQKNDFLPYGWMFKIIWEGFTKDKEWTQTLRYLSREGTSLESMKNVIDFINSGEGYSPADVENCKEFIKIQNSADRKYKWNDGGDTLPKGWKTRIADGEMKMEFILSPEGRMYRSRYVAIQDMTKRNYSEEDIEEMRLKMISMEDWKRNDLLPHNWLYKIKWEGQLKDNKWSENLTYFSSEGITFEANKPAAEFMTNSKLYSDQDVINCKEFVKRRNQETQEMRFSWNQGDNTIPNGWKMRKTEDREFILSPEGRQYMTRVVALTDMVKRGYEEEQLEEMRSKLMYEGWNTNQYLPRGWFWKMWEGETKRQKLDRNLYFVTREGVRIESFKAAIEYMESTNIYNAEDIEKIRQYKKAEAVDVRRRGYDWEDGSDTLPYGWMKRPGVGQNETERILSPEGEQYRSRFNALQNMVKNGCPRDEIEDMKNALGHEGWESIPLLPEGWLFKRIWEGTDSNGRTISNTHYISGEGQLFESVKSAVEHMQAYSVDYNEQHVEKFKEFQNLLCKVATKKREDWIEDETVPVGWKKRVIGVTGREYILRPDGKQFMTRCIALQHMMEDNYNIQEIRAMRAKLCFEGWNEDNCLPEGWLYKVWEGKINGRTSRSYKFFSLEGTVFESMKTAIEFMEMCGYYSEEAVENCRRFMKKENRNINGERFQWETEDTAAPKGWRTRITEGRKFFLMPDGNQFPSMFSAFQHMVKNDYLLSQINVVRSFLKQEGWEFDTNLPSGWQVKSKGPDSNWYIGRHGEFFENTEKAIEFIGSNSQYTIEDLDNLKEKIEGENSVKEASLNAAATPQKIKLKLKLNWLEHEALPKGWKIRKILNKSGTEVDHYLSPSGDTIAGRKDCWQYMTDNGWPMEDIDKIWKFNWKSGVSTKRKLEEDLSPASKKIKQKKPEVRQKRKTESDGGNPSKKQANGDNYSETLSYLKNISNIHNVDSRGVVDIVNRNM